MTTALDDDVAKAQRKSSSSGEETKARILAA